ncbi:MAG: YdeI/OmpD-associated family protein [Ignavibacteriota bacterium]
MKKFLAKLTKLNGPAGSRAPELKWRVLDVPFDAKKIFGKGGNIPIVGKVNGFEFRSSLFPRKNGPHFLLMNKTMQKEAGVMSLGDEVHVEIKLDTKERTVGISPELKKILAKEKGMLKYYEGFSYSMRKYFSDHITQAKAEPTRKKRVEELAIILMEMREGEIHPPPILEAEFAHNPKARQGWEKMSPSNKRSHLWGIFYYKQPDSRRRRLMKAIDAMVEYAKKRKGQTK